MPALRIPGMSKISLPPSMVGAGQWEMPMWFSASRAYSSGSVSRWYTRPKRVATAFFTMDWHAGTLWSTEFRLYPLTGNWPPWGIHRSQGRACTP